MRSTRNWLTITSVLLVVWGQPGIAQTPQPPVNLVESVGRLLKELRWHDNESHQQYLRIKDERTKRLLSEVDGFVTESYSPGTATADQVKAGLDALLGHKKGDMTESTALSVSLPTGQFLVVGVEVERRQGNQRERDVAPCLPRKRKPVRPAADTDYVHLRDISRMAAKSAGSLW
jgi:hypothetical protein